MKFDEFSRKDTLLSLLKSIAGAAKKDVPSIAVTFDAMHLNDGFGYKMSVKVSGDTMDKFLEVKNYFSDTFNWLLQGNIDVSSFTEDDERTVEFQVISKY